MGRLTVECEASGGYLWPLLVECKASRRRMSRLWMLGRACRKVSKDQWAVLAASLAVPYC